MRECDNSGHLIFKCLVTLCTQFDEAIIKLKRVWL